jgi:hypothetical protein
MQSIVRDLGRKEHQHVAFIASSWWTGALVIISLSLAMGQTLPGTGFWSHSMTTCCFSWQDFFILILPFQCIVLQVKFSQHTLNKQSLVFGHVKRWKLLTLCLNTVASQIGAEVSVVLRSDQRLNIDKSAKRCRHCIRGLMYFTYWRLELHSLTSCTFSRLPVRQGEWFHVKFILYNSGLNYAENS